MREYDIVGIIPPLRSDYLPINNNGSSTVKTYQMFSIRTTPEKFENGPITDHDGFVFDETSGKKIT